MEKEKEVVHIIMYIFGAPLVIITNIKIKEAHKKNYRAPKRTWRK
jgi:hypothetical protein